MRSQLLGCGFVLCTAVTWVAASFLAQHLVSGDQPSLHPFLLCYICTSLFSFYLPVLACKHWHASRARQGTRSSSTGVGGADAAAAEALIQPSAEPPAAAVGGPVLFPGHTRPAAVLKVLPVAVLFMLAQTLFTVSLANTSVTSNTILSSSASMWMLLTSALVLHERVTAIKLLSVLAVMAGTAMVTLADSSAPAEAGDHSLWGDALCLASAVCYSCYTVQMQQELREDDPDVPALYFGYIGVIVAVLGAPVVLALHLLGSFNLLALDPTALGLAVLNGVMDYVVADYTWARAVLLLSPTVATLGTSIQVPLATAADLVLGDPHWLDSRRAVGLTAAGTLLILGGVGGINLQFRSGSGLQPADTSRSRSHGAAQVEAHADVEAAAAAEAAAEPLLPGGGV